MNGIHVQDVANAFRDEIGSIGLKDIVYTHFDDRYRRPKKIQEYNDDFVALGGHNAEIDARYTAKVGKLLQDQANIKTPKEIRKIISEEKAIGAIFKAARRKASKKVPADVNSFP